MITPTFHPNYMKLAQYWEKYQLTYDGGYEYKARYLKQYSQDEKDFEERKEFTFIPPFAKEALLEILNLLSSKLPEVSRLSSDPRYMSYAEQNLNTFMSHKVIPQLLIKGKVGVYVDNTSQVALTRADEQGLPYMYTFQAEDILNWAPFDAHTDFSSVLLRKNVYATDENGLPTAKQTCYVLLKKLDSGILYEETVNSEPKLSTIIPLDQIPFHVFDIGESLLADVADYQIALFNMASSCVNYDIKSNFAVYTEQVDRQSQAVRQIEAANGIVQEDTRTIGTTSGIKYEKGLERPQYISPSSEPLKISLQHRELLKKEVRDIVYSTVTNIRPPDGQPQVEGLCSIAGILQEGENRLAQFWLAYVTERATVSVVYPKSYTAKNLEDRLATANKILESASRVSSITFKRRCAMDAIHMICGDSLTADEYESIQTEIDKSDSPIFAVKEWVDIVNLGLCTRATASQSLGFKESEAKTAEKEYAERLRMMAISQGGNLGSPAIQSIITGERKTGIKEEGKEDDN